MTSTDQTVQPDQISPADELFPSDALGEAARLSLPGTDSAPR
jgi:hypothetical protein